MHLPKEERKEMLKIEGVIWGAGRRKKNNMKVDM